MDTVSSPTRKRSAGLAILRSRWVPAVVLGGAAAALVGLTTAGYASGPSVYSRYNDQFHLIGAANQQVEVGRVTVPAGSYSVQAKMYVITPDSVNTPAQTVRCRLNAGADFDQTVVDTDWVQGRSNAALALQVVHTFTAAGPIVLTCGFDYTAGGTYLRFVKVTATATDAISNGPLSR